MKSLAAKLTSLPDKVVIALCVVFSLLASAAFLFLLAWPSYAGLSQVSADIAAEEVKLASINQATAFLAKEDKAKLNDLETFLAQLVPENVDMLHFATLNELVSESAGVGVVSIQLSKSAPKAATPASTTTTTTSPAAAGGVVPAQTSQAAATTVTVTYASNFDNILKLIKYWELADQLVGIKEIQISGVNADALNYTISFELPVSPAAVKAVVEDTYSLTDEVKKSLEERKARIIYTATPSSQTVGKNDPFN